MRCLDTMKVTEILRLREMDLNLRDVASAVDCSKTTVGEILNRCKDCGLTYEGSTVITSGSRNTAKIILMATATVTVTSVPSSIH